MTHSTLRFTPYLCRGCAVLGVAVGGTWVAAGAVCGASERGATMRVVAECDAGCGAATREVAGCGDAECDDAECDDAE